MNSGSQGHVSAPWNAQTLRGNWGELLPSRLLSHLAKSGVNETKAYPRHHNSLTSLGSERKGLGEGPDSKRLAVQTEDLSVVPSTHGKSRAQQHTAVILALELGETDS